MNAPYTPTTARTLAALATVATSVRVDNLNSANVVHTFVLPGKVTASVIISRRGGRMLRAVTTTPTGPVVRVRGTATEVGDALQSLALAA